MLENKFLLFSTVNFILLNNLYPLLTIKLGVVIVLYYPQKQFLHITKVPHFARLYLI